MYVAAFSRYPTPPVAATPKVGTQSALHTHHALVSCQHARGSAVNFDDEERVFRGVGFN